MGKGRKKKIPQKQNQEALASDGGAEQVSVDTGPVADAPAVIVPPEKPVQKPTPPPQVADNHVSPNDQTGGNGNKKDLTEQVVQPLKALDISNDVPTQMKHPPGAAMSPKRHSPNSPKKDVPSSPARRVETTTMMTSSVGFTKQELQPPKCAKEEKVGQLGRPIKVEVNFLPMKINIPGGTVYHYDCDFKFPWKREIRKSDRPFLIQVIEEFKKQHKGILGNPYSIVFDGLKNIYTCRRLNFPSGDFEEKCSILKDEDSQEKIEMTLKLKLVGAVEINHAVDEYIRRGTSATRPADAMQVLNIILGKVLIQYL